MHFDYALMYYSLFKMFLHINFMLTTQLMPTITWAKKSPSKSTHIGSKVHIKIERTYRKCDDGR